MNDLGKEKKKVGGWVGGWVSLYLINHAHVAVFKPSHNDDFIHIRQKLQLIGD